MVREGTTKAIEEYLQVVEEEIDKDKPETKEMVIKIEKQDEEKRLVYGVVLEPETVDLQGDIYDAETIEKSAHNFLYDVRRMGLMHKEFGREMKIAESYIVNDDKGYIQLNERKVKNGSWVLVCKVIDDDVWKGIKEGTYGGFSIGAYIKYLEGDELNV